MFFLVTGFVSFGLWWRGRVVHGKPLFGRVVDPLEISYVVNQTPAPENNFKQQAEFLVKDIFDLVSTVSGKYAFFVFHPERGQEYGLKENEVMPAASIMKVVVMVAVQEAIANGRMNPDDTYKMEEADRATGSGPLQFGLAGTNYKIADLLKYMGKNSDNTAWVMFNRRLGYQMFEDTLQEMGMTESSYQNLTTTAKDLARMWAYIYSGRAGNEEGKRAIWGYLTDSIYEDRIPLGVPDGTVVVHKVGTDDGVWSDAGIIMTKSGKMDPFILVILDKEVDHSQATKIVPEITRKVWNFESKNSSL